MASSYTVSWEAYKNSSEDGGESVALTYVITAHTDGSVTAISTDNDSTQSGITYTQLIKGRYLRQVEAFPTSGGTAPDAADVTVKDSDGLDLLNAGGANLIHATNKQSVYPLIDDVSAKVLVWSALTIGIANQSTNGADFTIRLIFQ
jgi:hypothetical protein